MSEEHRPFMVELTESQINAIKRHAKHNEIDVHQWFRRHLADWLCLQPTYRVPSELVQELGNQLHQLLQLQALIEPLGKLIDSHAKTYVALKEKMPGGLMDE